MKQTETGREVEIDVLQLIRALWKKAWLIMAAALLFGSLTFVYTKTCMTPMYRARTTMYVNNKNASQLPENSISASDLSASLHLVETYTVFLQSRSTLDEVADRGQLPYSYEKLKKMVHAEAIEDTSAFEVVVTSKNPEEAAQIANLLGEVLPEKIVSFIPGSSLKVVDKAVVPEKPFAPSPVKNAVLGALVGILLSGSFVVVLELLDNQVHSAEYLSQNYDIPVLAVIPDLLTAGNHGSYYQESASAARHSERGGNSHD